MMTSYNVEFIPEPELQKMPFAKIGSNVLIDRSVRIIGIENIELASNIRIDAGTIIIATGQVSIGSYVHIAANCYMEGRAGIQMDDFSGLAYGVSIHSVSDDFTGESLTNPTVPEEFKTLKAGKISLQRHALVGAKATILPGVTIEEGAVLGAHGLARKTIPAWTIYAGSPARFVMSRGKGLLSLEKKLINKYDNLT